jgi:two-component system, LytTR family, response regulator LytT
MLIKRCLIIEESDSCITTLQNCIKKLSLFECVVVKELKDVIYQLQDNTFDLIFVDIHFAYKAGINLFTLFPTLPPTIIITSATEYAIESFDIDQVTDFIVKPVSEARLIRAINRSLDIQFVNNSIVGKEFSFFKAGRQIQRFDYKDINYIEAYGVYSKIHAVGQVHLVNEPILALENALPSSTFRRVHKSYIININKIQKFNYKSFFIENIKIPIGVSYKSQVEGLLRLLNTKDIDENNDK